MSYLDSSEYSDGGTPYSGSDPPTLRSEYGYSDTASKLESSIAASAAPTGSYSSRSETSYVGQAASATPPAGSSGALESTSRTTRDDPASLLGESQVDYLILKGEQLDVSKLDPLKCFGPPSPPTPIIETYRPDPLNPYPFDSPDPANSPWDGPEGPWPGPLDDWKGPEYRRGVMPPEFEFEWEF
jgi:hypothetical protein